MRGQKLSPVRRQNTTGECTRTVQVRGRTSSRIETFIMADTRYLKSVVENHIRAWLKDRFDQRFKSVFLPLMGVQGSPRTHEFDAVSDDGTIVCGIKTASWRTS